MCAFLRSAGPVLAFALCVFGWSFQVHAQNSHCDPELEKLAKKRLGDNPQRYQPHGDRCEGIYIGQVGGSTLEIVSFTSAFADYSLDAGGDLVIEWPLFGSEEIQLRGHSLEPKIHYRMDSVWSASSASFRWPLDILDSLRIQKHSLGVVGSIQRRVGNSKRTVLVPLRITQGEQVSAAEPYTLLARPGVELEEVYVTLAALDAGGKVSFYLKDEKALEFGFYPAERVFDVPLADDLQPGLYWLSIAASLVDSGGIATAEAYLLSFPSR